MGDERLEAVETRVRALEMSNVKTEQILIGLKEGQDESLAILRALPCSDHATKLAVLERNNVHSAGKQERVDDVFWKVVGYVVTTLIGSGIGYVVSAAVSAASIVR